MEVQVTDEKALASRWSRLWAAIIDSMVIGAISASIYYVEPLHNLIWNSEFPTLLNIIYLTVVYFLINGYFLEKHGQTIGKNVFEISVVRLDGSHIGFKGILFKRYLPISVLASIPFIGVVAIVNVLFIFRKDRRCIHDLIAGTKVVDVSQPKEMDFSKIP